ncbi:MAG: hypothetical protein WCC48_06295, partial [Anaeromyxobacteraceae bacterium]
LGLSGWPRAAELCLGFMGGRGEVARLAGEAFAAITGLPIAGRFEEPEPEERDSPEDAPEEELLAGIEAELPAPDADEVAAWWRESSGRLDPGIRYVHGRPFGAETLVESFVAGTMRRRHALGRELLVRSHGAYAPDTRGWAREQLRFQAGRRLVARAEFAHPFSRMLRP